MSISNRAEHPKKAMGKMSRKCATANAWIVVPILVVSLSAPSPGTTATTSARSGAGYQHTPVHDDSDISGGYGCQWSLRPRGATVAVTDFQTLIVGLNGRDFRARWSGAPNTPFEGAYRFATVINGLMLNFQMIRRIPEKNPEVEANGYRYVVTATRGQTVVARWNLSGACGS